jgi:hypothetical protein
MSLTGGAAIQAALLQLGVYDPGETPSTSEQNQCLLIANEMLTGWYNEQVQALTVLLAGQNKAGLAYVAEQVRVTTPLTTAYVLGGATYTPPSYTAGSISGGTAPGFPDLTTPQTFPTGYDAAIVLNLAVRLISQYPSANPPQDLRQEAMKALAAAVPVPGKLPLPGMGYDTPAIPPPPEAQEVPPAQP